MPRGGPGRERRLSVRQARAEDPHTWPTATPGGRRECDASLLPRPSYVSLPGEEGPRPTRRTPDRPAAGQPVPGRVLAGPGASPGPLLRGDEGRRRPPARLLLGRTEQDRAHQARGGSVRDGRDGQG